MTREAAVQRVMQDFDFESVVVAMNALDRRFDGRAATIEAIKLLAVGLLRIAANDPHPTHVVCGGFTAKKRLGIDSLELRYEIAYGSIPRAEQDSIDVLNHGWGPLAD